MLQHRVTVVHVQALVVGGGWAGSTAPTSADPAPLLGQHQSPHTLLHYCLKMFVANELITGKRCRSCLCGETLMGQMPSTGYLKPPRDKQTGEAICYCRLMTGRERET